MTIAMSVGGAILGITSRLCMPAAGILGVALLGVVVRRRLRRTVYGSILGAHVTIMLAIEVTRALYATHHLPCVNAVPIHSFFSLSSACWVQSVCLYMVHKLKNTNLEVGTDSFISFLIFMLYSLFTPFVVLAFIDGVLQGPSIGSKTLLDAKTCFRIEGLMAKKGEIDASLFILLSRSVLLVIGSIIFVYLLYKTKKHNRGFLLCARDAGNIVDVLKRQEQAMRYVLLILGTYGVESTADVGVWFSKDKQPDSHPSESYLELIAAERVFKAFSLCIDFLRCIFVCDIIWCRGPNGVGSNQQADDDQPQRTEGSSDPPSYDDAVRQARLLSTSSPPTYTSLFGFRYQSNEGNLNHNTSDNQQDALNSPELPRRNFDNIPIAKCVCAVENMTVAVHYPSRNNEGI